MAELDDIRNLNIQKKIYRLRRKGLNWVLVASKVSEEFDNNLSSKQAQELYDKYISRSETIHSSRVNGRKEAFEVNETWSKEMKELIENIKGKALKHLAIADELLISQYDAGNTKAYFDNLPVAISLFRSLLDQANFLGRRLEKIEVNQTSFILNETQILQLVNKQMAQKEKEAGYSIHPGTGDLVIIDQEKNR